MGIFTPEIEKICLEKFKEFDKDNSGSIDKSELIAILKALGKNTSQEDVDQMVSLFLLVFKVFYPN